MAGGELRQMRIDLKEALREHRLVDHSALLTMERVALVATELASNALKHGRPPAVVRLLRADGHFILDVADQDRNDLPEVNLSEDSAEGGRGLYIARSLAAEICWYATEHGKHVWVSFLIDPALAHDGDSNA